MFIHLNREPQRLPVAPAHSLPLYRYIIKDILRWKHLSSRAHEPLQRRTESVCRNSLITKRVR